ncbi:MAG: 4Fe-4S binding protein [Sedimentisphaerales bacterium]
MDTIGIPAGLAGPFGPAFAHNVPTCFHCYACPLSTFACPIGVIAQFGALHIFPFMTVGLLIAVGALFVSLICGWVCPFGLLQDLVAKVPTPKFDPPK